MKNLIIPQPLFGMLMEMPEDEFNLLIKTLIDHVENNTEPPLDSPIYMPFHVWKVLLDSN